MRDNTELIDVKDQYHNTETLFTFITIFILEKSDTIEKKYIVCSSSI